MSDEKTEVEFSLDQNFQFPCFNSMWKEWIQYEQGMPQNWQSRERAKKLFERVFILWTEEIRDNIQKVADKAYETGRIQAEKEIGEARYKDGIEMGILQARREMKRKLLDITELDDLPDNEEDIL